MLLHGNLIAVERHRNNNQASFNIHMRGFATKTTLSRLNAILVNENVHLEKHNGLVYSYLIVKEGKDLHKYKDVSIDDWIDVINLKKDMVTFFYDKERL